MWKLNAKKNDEKKKDIKLSLKEIKDKKQNF